MPVDFNVFHKVKTVADFDREAEQHALRRQAILQRQTGQNPAAIQIADEIAKARAAGDTQRVNDLIASAKLYDRGVSVDQFGNPVALPGYGDAIGSIEGTKSGYKQQAVKDVDLTMLPQIEAAKVDSKIKAENTANAQVGLPAAEAQANEVLNLINGIENDPGLSAVVGAPNPLKGRIPFIGNVAGSPAADFQAKLDQLGGKQFLEAFQSLKGGGQITEVEGQKATNAIARMQTAQSEEAFREALQEFKGIVQSALERSRAKAGVPVLPDMPILPGTNQVAPQPSPSSAPKPGSLVDGYMFMGGDPAKQSNWQKVQ